jgi:hypothetical protein
MFFLVVVQSFKIHLLEYILFWIYLLSLCDVGIMRVICGDREDAYVVLLSVLVRMHHWL